MRRWMALAVIAACASTPSLPDVSVIRMNGLFVAKPAGCDIKFENGSYLGAALQYINIGMLTLTGEGVTFNESARKLVRDKACSIGGDVVVPNVAIDNVGGGAGMLQFTVWRRPEGAPAQAPAKTTPTSDI